MDKVRILIIDDSPDMRKLMRLTLRKERYHVTTVKYGRSGLALADKIHPNLVILDIGLPDVDGLDILKSLRARERMPVIILTASTKEADCLVGLKLGADDYLVKPISMTQLAARVEAVLSRNSARPVERERSLEAGTWRLDPETHEFSVNGETILLAPKEFHILRLLLEARGEVVSRRKFLLEVWDYTEDQDMDARMVDQYVSRIRRKLKREAPRIVTIPTLGYKIKP
ncbi:MAG: response regulator transcription factor [Elusimicrobia bacterium]|nr:response regulator transcription factor [Elusimicrobiota bacterium]